jgi:hypothetical protein
MRERKHAGNAVIVDGVIFTDKNATFERARLVDAPPVFIAGQNPERAFRDRYGIRRMDMVAVRRVTWRWTLGGVLAVLSALGYGITLAFAGDAFDDEQMAYLVFAMVWLLVGATCLMTRRAYVDVFVQDARAQHAYRVRLACADAEIAAKLQTEFVRWWRTWRNP